MIWHVKFTCWNGTWLCYRSVNVSMWHLCHSDSQVSVWHVNHCQWSRTNIKPTHHPSFASLIMKMTKKSSGPMIRHCRLQTKHPFKMTISIWLYLLFAEASLNICVNVVQLWPPGKNWIVWVLCLHTVRRGRGIALCPHPDRSLDCVSSLSAFSVIKQHQRVINAHAQQQSMCVYISYFHHSNLYLYFSLPLLLFLCVGVDS